MFFLPKNTQFQLNNHLERANRKTESYIRAAHFRYQAMIEQIQYLPQRGLDKNLIARLADTDFIKRAENVFITGATRCGKRSDFYDLCKCLYIIFVIFFSSRNTGKNTMD